MKSFKNFPVLNFEEHSDLAQIVSSPFVIFTNDLKDISKQLKTADKTIGKILLEEFGRKYNVKDVVISVTSADFLKTMFRDKYKEQYFYLLNIDEKFLLSFDRI